jgi:molybdopterin synthase catalytic subunit
MPVDVLFFGRLRTAATRSWECGLTSPTTARAVFAAACERFPALGATGATVRVAVNERYAGWDAVVADRDVVAFIPPVAGGAGRVSVHIGAGVIDVAAMSSALRSDRDGGLCVFTGHVRDNTDGEPVEALDYSAYESMAVRQITDIATRLCDEHGARAVAVAHRLGHLEIGEVSVAVVVAATHRDAAFATCRALVDEIKADAPIFKLEIRPGGARWVESCR